VQRLLAAIKAAKQEKRDTEKRSPDDLWAEIQAGKKLEEMQAFWAKPKGKPAVAAARLYKHLEAFRGTPEFHQFGFGRGGPFYAWMPAAEKVAEWHGKAGAQDFLANHDCTLGELAALGMAYAESNGRPTDYTRDVDKRLGAALRAIAHGEGIE